MLKQLLFKRELSTAVANPLLVKNNVIQASIILARGPQIIRDASPFEKAYFDYCEKRERGAAATTPTEFYFKKGSVAERRWKHDEKARQEAMNQSQSLSEALVQSNESWEKENEGLAASNKYEKLSRQTEADRTNDQKKLDRALQKSLYLVVKSAQANRWQFPQGPLNTTEYLHEAAERTLKEQCGADLDTWFVGRQPIAFYKQTSQATTGSKTFFMKARIFAGQVKPGQDVLDFAWLTKDELADRLDPEYYKSVMKSLSHL